MGTRGRRRWRGVLAGAVVVTATLLAGLVVAHDPEPQPAGADAEVAKPNPTTSTSAQPMVPWTGPVEHLFFHTLIVRPDLAFAGGDHLERGFRDYFVTVPEFRAILGQLHANGWTLVDIHRAASGSVKVPPGRKPLVLSIDDVNFYDYSRPRGSGWRLVLDGSGAVRVEVRDDTGTRVSDEDIIPLVDDFVAAHPEFSAEGAKGVVALTGYEGAFGERTNNTTDPDHADSVARATAVAQRLKATGWKIASHSYGHLDLSRLGPGTLRADAERWLAEIGPIVGPTDVFIYPFGATPSRSGIGVLAGLGFTLQCDIDKVARMRHDGVATIMSRRHIDGLALEQQAEALRPFFDVATVIDTYARAGA